MITTLTALMTSVPQWTGRRARTGVITAVLAAALALAGCGAGQSDDVSSRAAEASGAPATSAVFSSAAPATSAAATAAEPAQAEQTELAAAPSTAVSTAQTTAAASEPTCATTSGSEALEQNLSKVPADSRGYPWTADYAETDGYDPCAALSWITVPIEGGTASSPYQIMLFHHGQYIGTTASDGIGFHPDVVRLSDSEIQVTYTYPLQGETTAGASGRSVSTFTWDESTGSIVHDGDWPPDVQG